jgi:transposase
MISFAADIRIYVKLEGIDFRCGLNRLVPLARSCFESDVRERAVFVFRNKARTDIKLIFFDRNGFFASSWVISACHKASYSGGRAPQRNARA